MLLEVLAFLYLTVLYLSLIQILVKKLTYGQQGEVCITGPNTMLGYLNNEVATAEILRTHEDGRIWVHSGDLGTHG